MYINMPYKSSSEARADSVSLSDKRRVVLRTVRLTTDDDRHTGMRSAHTDAARLSVGSDDNSDLILTRQGGLKDL